jgi:hypothetical protein
MPMRGSRLLVVAFVNCLAVFACGSSIQPPDECARCFAENRRLTGRIDQLLVRVGQLEAELSTHHAAGRGECAASALTMMGCYDGLYDVVHARHSVPV